MYVSNRVLYDNSGNPCVVGDKVKIVCDDGKIIIDTITLITDEQDKGCEDNEIYLNNMCIPLYNIEKGYKVFPEENTNGCNCCLGDKPLYWMDNENNAFVDNKGEVMVTVKDRLMRFKVKYCPNCGKKF